MEHAISVTAKPDAYCYACAAKVADEDVFCTSCGYPLKGTDLDQKTFIARRQNAHIDMAAFNQKIRRAGNSLYYLAGLFMLMSLISFFTNKDNPDVLGIVIPLVILAGLFLALGSYSRKKPLACLVSGLALYVIVQVLLAIDNPINIASGVIWKIFIIGYLIAGIKSAIEIEKVKKENNLA